MGYPTDDDFENARRNRTPPAVTVTIQKVEAPDPDRFVDALLKETNAAHAAMDAKESQLDEHGYGRPPGPCPGCDRLVGDIHKVGCRQLRDHRLGRNRVTVEDTREIVGLESFTPATERVLDPTAASIEAMNARILELERIGQAVAQAGMDGDGLLAKVRNIINERASLRTSHDLLKRKIHQLEGATAVDASALEALRRGMKEREHLDDEIARLNARVRELEPLAELGKVNGGKIDDALATKARNEEKRRLADAKAHLETVSKLRSQVSEMAKQRDNAEERFNKANHHHGETSAALSAMTIKWLYLENATKDALFKYSDAISRAEAEVKDCRRLLAEHAKPCTCAETINALNAALDAERAMRAQDTRDVTDAYHAIARMQSLCDAAQRWAATEEPGERQHPLERAVDAYEKASADAANEQIPGDSDLPSALR